MIKGLVLLFLLFGICKGETCNCYSYLISEDGLSNENKIANIVTELENVRCDGDGLIQCRNSCEDMFRKMSDNGKLCKKMPGKDLRVADFLCSELKKDIRNGRIGVFAENCQGDPIDTGFRFTETLSCKDGYALYC